MGIDVPIPDFTVNSITFSDAIGSAYTCEDAAVLKVYNGSSYCADDLKPPYNLYVYWQDEPKLPTYPHGHWVYNPINSTCKNYVDLVTKTIPKGVKP